jgi:enoyl-CoA hydratase/carnithine racemase
MADASKTESKDVREFATLHAEVQGPRGRLVLNRPERLNAVNATMLRELAQAARWFDEHRELRVVIVSGAGRAFCAGADLKDSPAGEAFADGGKSWLYRREAGQYGLRAADALEQMRAVTIAQVHGWAVGGGVVLTAVCDLRVAADDAVFFIPEVDLGLPLAWGGIPRLVREIGPAMTKELVMTCRRFGAAEGKALGFLNRVVPPSQLEPEVEALAAELAEKPSVPVVVTKEHVNAVTRVMSAGLTPFADGDVLVAAAGEEESQASARAYTEGVFARKGRTPK